jgi:NNP family nitrate/nitrite transporter-like MFS transporter
MSISRTGSPAAFFWGLIVFFVVAVAINWYYYARRGCERPS